MGMKNPLESMRKADTAAASSGCIHSGVARGLARVLIASIDVPVARFQMELKTPTPRM